MTGCRLGEALALTWHDVDLERGRVTIRASKTGRSRVLPLAGAPEGTVAPRFLEVLRLWRMQAGDRLHVLPHDGLEAPRLSKYAWETTARLAKVDGLAPQALRQNLTSYAASLGIPASVAALWQGHRTDVAERFYRTQVLDRAPGNTFEVAMGLGSILERISRGDTPSRVCCAAPGS